MPEHPFDCQSLDVEDFDTCLTKKYDLIFLETEAGPYHSIAFRCEECGAINQTVYAHDSATLDVAMDAAGSITSVVDESYDDDDPEVGFFVCLKCGNGFGTDISSQSRLVTDSDNWDEYEEYRMENEMPI